jgi:hypothetical protein
MTTKDCCKCKIIPTKVHLLAPKEKGFLLFHIQHETQEHY